MFCLFVGYPRSGHSLIGSLIDAHPDAIIAHELDSLRYVNFGFSRNQLFWLLLDQSRTCAQRGRKWSGYSYVVPGQHQGRFRQLRVIGDKRGGDTSRRLANDFALLDRLQRRVSVPVKIIHVVRHPLDNITTMVLRGDAPSLEGAIDAYKLMVNTVQRVFRAVGDIYFKTVWLDDLTSKPEQVIRELCTFFSLQPHEDYVKDCAKIVFKQPKQTRHQLSWSPQQRDLLRRLVEEVDFLARYAEELA
jgi:hypothetical protein